jgi:hypothetical protein
MIDRTLSPDRIEIEAARCTTIDHQATLSEHPLPETLPLHLLEVLGRVEGLPMTLSIVKVSEPSLHTIISRNAPSASHTRPSYGTSGRTNTGP